MRDLVLDDLLLVGTNHRVADVERRGRLALSADVLPGWLAGFRSRADARAVRELFVLSTCNRLEIYAATSDPAAAEAAIRSAVTERTGADLLGPGESRYRLAGDAVVEHLYRVSAGLDSLLIGEAEILGQVRHAAETARRAGTLGRRLASLVTAALTLGRRVRQETRIGVGATSAAGAAVVLAEQTLGGLAGRSALVIGAGHAGRLALSRLAKRRPAQLFLANRTIEAADGPARKARAVVRGLADVPTLLSEVDAVIAAIPASEPIVTRALVLTAMAARPARPLVLVDLSVPVAIAPDVAGIAGVQRFGLEALCEVQAASEASRRREVPSVEALIRQALAGTAAAPSGNFATDTSV